MNICNKHRHYLTSRMVIVLSVILILILNAPGVKLIQRQKTVLVFGGNGFIGATTVEKLLRENAYIVVVNRGNWYWDSATRIKPYVHVLHCDRRNPLIYCDDLIDYSDSEDRVDKFDFVVDFSGLTGEQVRDVIETFEGRIRKYIYISSGSIYEVCKKNHSNPTTEEDAVRPLNKEEREKFVQKDPYGSAKLDGEEELRIQSQHKSGGVPYIALRLPDVIGPRDSSNRWWLYQMWIQLGKYLDRKLSVPRWLLNRPISFVYVDDVANLICDVVFGRIKEDSIYNQAFNIASEENLTLTEFLNDLIRKLKSDSHVEILDNDNRNGLRFYPSKTLQEVYNFDNSATDFEESLYFYPSVTHEQLNIEKAKKLLNWKSTPWAEVLHITAAFYESAVKDQMFAAEWRHIIKTLKKHFVKDGLKVINGLNEKYNLKLGRKNSKLTAKKDEL